MSRNLSAASDAGYWILDSGFSLYRFAHDPGFSSKVCWKLTATSIEHRASSIQYPVSSISVEAPHSLGWCTGAPVHQNTGVSIRLFM